MSKLNFWQKFGFFALGLVSSSATLVAANSAIFSDVEGDAWFYPYVTEIKELGIINGHPDGSFRPGEYVNRAELAKILVEYKKSVLADVDARLASGADVATTTATTSQTADLPVDQLTGGVSDTLVASGVEFRVLAYGFDRATYEEYEPPLPDYQYYYIEYEVTNKSNAGVYFERDSAVVYGDDKEILPVRLHGQYPVKEYYVPSGDTTRLRVAYQIPNAGALIFRAHIVKGKRFDVKLRD